MFDYNSMMALKEMVSGQEDPDIVQNHNKGSILNPSHIASQHTHKEVAKPHAKIQAKIGEKFKPTVPQPTSEQPPKVDPRHQIWSEEEVRDLPVSLHDPRKQPVFESLYRQRVGTEDVFLGLNGSNPSSNCCQEITYRIELPNTVLKDIQIDLNESQMVVQTKDYYLCQYFQYKTDPKATKAKFISDKSILELVIPIIRNDDF